MVVLFFLLRWNIMRYVFLNKSRELFVFNYDEERKMIDKIVLVKDKKYLPLKLANYSDEKDLLNKFRLWLNNRYSKNGSWLKQIQKRCGEMITSDFIIKSYGLSLSDQYWIKPEFGKEYYGEVNFFQKDFKYKTFLKNNLGRVYDYRDVDILYSPNITTGGELDKAWAIDEMGLRVLYKASNTFLGLEPINEYIASIVGQILEVPVVSSTIKILSDLEDKMKVSVCETFISPKTELVYAEDIVDDILDEEEAFNDYVDKLTGFGITDAREKIQKMLLLDMIMANSDRHKQNYGVIRDVETLEFLDVAPIYDSGRSMATDYPSLKQYKENYCLFNRGDAKRCDVLKLVKGLELKREQVDKLREVPKLYQNTLEEYFNYTNLRDELRESDIQALRSFMEKNLEESLSYITYL